MTVPSATSRTNDVEQAVNAMARALCQVRHGSEGTNRCVASDMERHEAEGIVGALDWLTGYRLVRKSR